MLLINDTSAYIHWSCVFNDTFVCIEWELGRSTTRSLVNECEIKVTTETEELYFVAFFRRTGLRNGPVARVLGGRQWEGDIVLLKLYKNSVQKRFTQIRTVSEFNEALLK